MSYKILNKLSVKPINNSNHGARAAARNDVANDNKMPFVVNIEYINTLQNVKQREQLIIRNLYPVTLSIALIRPRWFAATHENIIIATSNQNIVYAVVTFTLVVTAILLVPEHVH